MNTTKINYESESKKYKKQVYFIIGFIFILLVFLLLLSMPAQATEDVYGIVHNNTISWNWSDTAIGHISVDGVYIYGFVPNTTDYQNTFTDELPTAHKIVIYEGTTWGILENVGENTSITTGEPTATNDFIKTLNQYIWLILGVILIVIGLSVRRTEFNLIAGLVAFIGLGVTPQGDLIGTLVYALLLIIAVYTSFGEI